MAYRLSRARREFDHEVDLLRSALRDAHRGGGIPAHLRTHVTCSCVLLCMARLEVYLEDVVSEWLSELGSGVLQAGSLPSRLRALYVHDSKIASAYRQFFLDGDEGRLLDGLAGSLGSTNYQLVPPTGLVPTLHPKRVTDKKYPSPKNLKRLFSRIGLPNIFADLNRSAQGDMDKVLQSFNDMRTAVAHDGVPPGASHGDIQRQLRGMKSFVLHLDRVFYRHVSRHTGDPTWPA